MRCALCILRCQTMLGLFWLKVKKTEDEPAVPHDGQRQCIVCQAKLRSHVKRHVLAIHLPC